MEKKRAVRYGIAEWYGVPIHDMDTAERQAFGAVATADSKRGEQKVPANKPCRFAAELYPDAVCNKPGGVCTINPYWYDSESSSVGFNSDPVTVCPRRFLEDASLLQWVAEVMLGSSEVDVIREVPFLRNAGANRAEEDSARSGRIDWLLVNPSGAAPSMAALEIQGLYFSGLRMTDDFEIYETSDSLILPRKNRRPDYRSGGAKRLAPQLSVKVPLLRNWNIKTAVLVDRYFYNQMASFPETHGVTLDDRLAASDIVWFIADYVAGKITPGEVKCASLDDSIKGLSATEVMSKATFMNHVDRSLTRTGIRLT